MATKLGKIAADFTTSLATALSVSGTSATLQSATDDDGVTLATGKYYFTIDGSNSSKEHITCDLSGTALTNIQSVSRQGALTTGVARAHRIGASIAITDFAYIKVQNDLLDGTTDFDASTPLKYDGDPTISNDEDFATKKYVDDTALSGAPNASTTVKGVAEEATEAEINADTAAGGTSARLFTNPSTLATSKYGTQLPSSDEKDALASTTTPGADNLYITESDFQIGDELYAADAGSNDTYVITLDPVPAGYVEGMVVRFKANTANTGACTLNVNSLGAKTLKKEEDVDLETGDIKADQMVTVIYDSNGAFQVTSPLSNYMEDGDLEYATGVSSRSMTTATGTQNIAHGLNTTPTRIKIYAVNGNTSGTHVFSTGTYDGTTNNVVFMGNSGSSSNATQIVNLSPTGSQIATATVDGTNIILSWTKTSSPTGTAYLLWEAWVD